jgi:hypothetical protein
MHSAAQQRIAAEGDDSSIENTDSPGKGGSDRPTVI